MKYFKIITMALICMGFFSCEKRHINDNLYDSSVYIINNGLQTETLYDVEGKTHTFTINTYCAGFYGGNPNVRLVYNKAGVLDAYNQENGTSYKLLPENCYKLESRHLVMEDSKVAFTVTFDCDRIAALSNDTYYSDIQDYVIPYTVVCETEGVVDALVEGIGNIIIKPEMHKMSFDLVAPKPEDITSDEQWYYVPFKLKTAIDDNKWGSGYEFGMELTDKDGVALSEENYAVTCSVETESFVDGVSEITYEVKVLKSFIGDALDALVNIKTTVNKVEGGFDYLGKNVIDWKFEVYQIYTHKPAADDQIDWNSWNGNKGYPPKNIFDNNDGNWWESCTNTSQNSTNGKDDRAEYWTTGFPAFVGIDFKEEINIHSVCFVGRKDGWGGRLRSCGLRYNWENKLVTFTDAEKESFGTNQWKPSVEDFEAKHNEWFGEGNWWIWDVSYLQYKGIKTDFTSAELNHPNGSNLNNDTDGFDNQIGRKWYATDHWFTLAQPVRTDKIQVWVTSSSWDYFTPNSFGNGSCTNLNEVKIRLAHPGVTEVK